MIPITHAVGRPMMVSGASVYRPDDWQRLCALHDQARMDELRASGHDCRNRVDGRTTGNGQFAASGHVLRRAATRT